MTSKTQKEETKKEQMGRAVPNLTITTLDPPSLLKAYHNLWNGYATGQIQAKEAMTFVRMSDQIVKIAAWDMAAKRFVMEHRSAAKLAFASQDEDTMLQNETRQ